MLILVFRSWVNCRSALKHAARSPIKNIWTQFSTKFVLLTNCSSVNWICIFWESSSMKNPTGKQQKDYSPSCPSPVCWPMLPSCRWLVCLSHPQLQTDYRTSRTSSLRTKKSKSNYKAVPQPAIFNQKECKTVVFNFNGLGKITLFLSYTS